MARVLITGGAGFIGSHLCEYLLNRGHEVICLDNFFSGDKGNIRPLLNNHYFEFIRHDIIHPLFLEVDRIYHLACPASPVYYQYNPIKTIKTNVMGTINMLGLAKRIKARILLASTSEVYGDPLVHPQKEDYWGHTNPLGPRACYDEGKRVAETLMFDYYRQNRVEIRIVRIFNTYGPRMAVNDGRVVSNFIVQALKGEDLTIYGEGRQTRSFCYVSDLVEGIVGMMEAENLTGPVNLGNPREISILDLAQKILQLTRGISLSHLSACTAQAGRKEKSKLVFNPLPLDDPRQRKPDIGLAREKLNWGIKVDLEEGLKRTIAYFRKRLKICVSE